MPDDLWIAVVSFDPINHRIVNKFSPMPTFIETVCEALGERPCRFYRSTGGGIKGEQRTGAETSCVVVVNNR